MKKPTIMDISALTGVSKSTVSRALNNESVSDEVKQKIEWAIKECGYEKKKKNVKYSLDIKNVAIITSEYVNTPGVFYYEMMHEIQNECSRIGLKSNVILINTNYNKERLKRKLTASDSIIIVGSNDFDLLPLLKATGKPIILTNEADMTMSTSSVCPDYNLGGYLAGQYLVSKGHKKIKMLLAETRFTFTHRMQGFMHAMKDNQISDYEVIDIFEYCRNSKKSKLNNIVNKKSHEADFNSSDILPELIKENLLGNCTAIFCSCDLMAISLINALEDVNINVPNDISIIGFDNIPTSQWLSVPLTTIDCDFKQLAHNAIHLLIQEASKEEDNDTKRVSLKVSLIERESVRNIK